MSRRPRCIRIHRAIPADRNRPEASGRSHPAAPVRAMQVAIPADNRRIPATSQSLRTLPAVRTALVSLAVDTDRGTPGTIPETSEEAQATRQATMLLREEMRRPITTVLRRPVRTPYPAQQTRARTQP